MNFRMAEEKDRASIKWLWAYCFEPQGDPFYEWYFDKYFALKNTIVGMDGNKLICSLQLNPYEIMLRDAVFSAPYIVGLATMPEGRSGGLIGKLLTAALDVMRKNNDFISLLMPSTAGFYYQFDWELCYHHYKYKTDIAELKSVTGSNCSSYHLVDVATDIPKLDAVYKKFMLTRHGYVIRNEQNWYNLITSYKVDRGYVYFIMNQDEPQGYIMFHIDNRHFYVKEMAFLNLNVQKSIYKFIYNHRSQAETVEWHTPLDDRTYLRLPDPKDMVYLQPVMTARIADVQQVLSRVFIPEGVKGEITVKIIDDLAAWNNGAFSLTSSNGRLCVQSNNGQDADVTCRIGALSQLVFGAVSAKDLATMGSINDAKSEHLTLLDAMFPAQINYINEYF